MNFENTMQLILEKYIINLYDEFIIEHSYDNNMSFNFDMVISLTDNTANLEKLKEYFNEYFGQQTGKELIYNYYKEYSQYYDNDYIEELLNELTYHINDLYFYFNGVIFYKFQEFIEQTIDILDGRFLK